MSIIQVSSGARGTKLFLSDTDKINLCLTPITAGAYYSGLTDLAQNECTEKFRTKELRASDFLQAIIVKNNECEGYKKLLAIPAVQKAVELHLAEEKKRKEAGKK